MSSTNVGSIHYDLKLDTSKFDSAVEGLNSKLSKVGDRMQDVGKRMSTFVTLPIVAGFGLAVKAASDMNETLNKIDVAFKDQADSVKAWAKDSIKNMGLAQSSALDAAALFGDMSTAMGLNTTEAASMSKSLVQLGADLASFKNIRFEEAQTALAGIYTGETESLKRLGIVMTETNLLEFAKAQGIKKTLQEMTQAEKVNLRYAYVMSVTKNAQGDFVRTADGTANQMRMTSERVKELSANIGQRLLPIAGRLLEFANKLLTKFESLSPAQQDMILKALMIAAVLGPLIWILGTLASSISAIITLVGSMSAAIGGASAAFTGFSALVASPIVMPALVIAAALASIYAVYEAVQSVRAAIEAMNNAQKSVTSAMKSDDAVIGRLKELQKNGTPEQKARARKTLAQLAETGAFARGTAYAPGGMALVGERGPELVDLPRGSQVHTNAQTKRMLGGDSTQTNVYIGTVKNNSDENYIMRRMNRDYERASMGVSI